MTRPPATPAPCSCPPRPAVLHLVETDRATFWPGLLFTNLGTSAYLHIAHLDSTYSIAHLSGEDLRYLKRHVAACGCP
ncbi:hypothetical protein [Planomonospora sp. ID82291]|uniref:hypothetical protein n=1 Tax=Planomonospora sp. ID82291 TaxID=2738136 RepID=UPI0018C38F0E|nr:hypothetical protein [Planomonospora sp. ID82291]MBG0818308.1 hypothetical protein [Planomonospora sp. ID82291]